MMSLSLESPIFDHEERVSIFLIMLAVLGISVYIKYHQAGIKKLNSTVIQNFSQISVDDRSSDTDATLTTVTPLGLSPHTISNSNFVTKTKLNVSAISISTYQSQIV